MKMQRVYCEVGKKFKIEFALILLLRLLPTSESAVASDYDLLGEKKTPCEIW